MYKSVCQCHCTRGEPKLEAKRLEILSLSVKEWMETKWIVVWVYRQTDGQTIGTIRKQNELIVTWAKVALKTQWPNEGCHCNLRPLCLRR